jgi:hypothetical protein
MVIPTIQLLPSQSDGTEVASILTSQNPSPSDRFDCKVPPRNRKVVGSNPTSGSTTPQVRGMLLCRRSDLSCALIGSGRLCWMTIGPSGSVRIACARLGQQGWGRPATAEEVVYALVGVAPDRDGPSVWRLHSCPDRYASRIDSSSAPTPRRRPSRRQSRSRPRNRRPTRFETTALDAGAPGRGRRAVKHRGRRRASPTAEERSREVTDDLAVRRLPRRAGRCPLRKQTPSGAGAAPGLVGVPIQDRFQDRYLKASAWCAPRRATRLVRWQGARSQRPQPHTR